jgi:chromosome segregation ATPase
MGSDRSGELIAYARDLERRDEDVARRIAHAGEVLHRVDDVRTRAERIRSALDAIPAEIARAEAAVVEAQAREADARREAVEAERKLADVQSSRRASEDARVAVERAVRRANVLVTDAAEGVARQQERLRLLRSDQVALGAEAEGLAVEALAVARDVAEVPRVSESGRKAPGASLEEIEEWGARAHSALFVVRGGLETERERIVHEATALAESALGEQVAGSSVARVRRRLEQEFNRL